MRPAASLRLSVVLLALTVVGAGVADAATPTRLRVGVVHGERSVDPWNPPASVAAAQHLLAASPGTLQNQHLMGWGTTSPQPWPGRYDWRSLDQRVELIRRTRGTPVLTLCCAPDWMKGGLPGRTDWSRLEQAPRREHFDEFAAMAAAVARRYPDVRHFLVWNEMKGFWDRGRNRWNSAAYTDLYNQVHRALKAVDRRIQVGGPYVNVASWRHGVGGGRDSAVAGPWGMVDQRALDVVTHWLDHAVGADFVVVDGSASLRDGTFLVPPAESAEKFAAVNGWLRARTDLPIWWAEAYPVPYGSAARFGPEEEATAWLAAVRAMERSGAAVAMLWQPESTGNHRGLWTSTRSSTGGRPTRLHATLRPWLR